jgi:hypothetical protein
MAVSARPPGGSPATNVHCDSGDILVSQFDLAGVQPGAYFDPQSSDRVPDHTGTSDLFTWPDL